MELSEIGKSRISDESAAGAEVRDEASFESLQAEIDKLSNPAASGATDWGRVVQFAAELLEKKGKDLLVAGYLAVALTETRKLDGLRVGLQVLADLLDTYWETMFPPLTRIRARRAAIEWWAGRTATALQTISVSPVDPETMAGIDQNLERIDRILRDKDPDGPALSNLKTLIRKIPVQEQPPQNDTAKPQAESGIASAPFDAGTIASLDAAADAVDALLEKLGNVASWILDHEPSSPLAYRLNRIAVWGKIDNPPPANDGKSKVPGPGTQRRKELATLVEAGNPANLSKFAEVQLSEHPFWLDLNRISAEALAAQGPDFVQAANAVVAETAGFLRRMEKLETLAFADGTAFADNATRNWLRSVISAGTTDGDRHAGEQSGAEPSEFEKALQRVEELAHQGQLIKAAGKLQQTIQAVPSGRDRLIARIRFCEALLFRGVVADMSPYLGTLLDELERRDLESFDPELALKVLSVAYRSIGDNQSASDARIDRAALLKRIAALDYQQALKLTTE